MTKTLEGRAALITGASQGLGVAIAQAFVDAGASVMLCARDAAMLDRARDGVAGRADGGQRVVAHAADVSSRTDVDRLVRATLEAFPDLQILVNNAGIYGPMGASEDVDWDAWVRAMEINVFGSVLACRALLPHFKRRRYGKIVQLSGGGATTPLPRLSAYAASKAAIVRFAESLALEVKADGIDVNAIAPGALNTRMMRELLGAGPAAVGQSFYDRMKKIADEGATTPLEKGAALTVFLASPASDGITGKLLSAAWDPWDTLPDHRADLDRTDVYTLRRIIPQDRGLPWGRS
jgi:NAD(P)-dependent dehydrogenase (short-subunit alcohol dehydrogenase family)